MPHLNIYVDEASAKVIAKAAKREALSLSKWARGKLLAAAGAPEWPADYSAVLGSIHDESFAAPAESALGQDQAVRFE